MTKKILRLCGWQSHWRTNVRTRVSNGIELDGGHRSSGIEFSHWSSQKLETKNRNHHTSSCWTSFHARRLHGIENKDKLNKNNYILYIFRFFSYPQATFSSYFQLHLRPVRTNFFSEEDNTSRTTPLPWVKKGDPLPCRSSLRPGPLLVLLLLHVTTKANIIVRLLFS